MRRKSHFNTMDHNLIFLHLPKNGGSTFHTILNRLYPLKETFTIKLLSSTELNTQDFINLPADERKNIHLLKGHMQFGLHQYLTGETKYISFLRKPIDRIVSFYYYVLRQPTHRLYDRIVKNKLSLHDFVTQVNENDIHNAQIRWISGIDASENEMLGKALENIEKHFSFVGLQEKFDESIILLKKIYGWKIPYYLIENQTKKKPAVIDLDHKTREVIKELNNGDYILYENIKKQFEHRLTKETSLNFELKKLRLLNKLYSLYSASPVKKIYHKLK